MSKKVRNTKASTSTKIDVLGLFRKGKELYDEYGDTIVALADSIGLKDKLMKGKADTPVVKEEQVEIEEQTVEEEITVEETDIIEEGVGHKVKEHKDIRTIRAELERDDSFHECLSSLEDATSIVADGRVTNPNEVMKAVETLLNVAQDTIKYSEEQETKREEIRAMRDVAIQNVNAMRDIVQTYLDKTFDERSALFAKQFECVDAALRDGNNDMLAMSLNSINSLASSSPFKKLADINEVKNALSSSGTEWNI